MPKWTTAADVTSRWIGDEPPPADTAAIETLLEDVEDTILREFPNIETAIDEATVPLLRVQKIAARIVIRHLRNPAGKRSAQRGAGPFQQSETWGGAEPGSPYLSDEDRAELGGNRSGSAFSVDSFDGAAWTAQPDTWRPISFT